VCVDDANAVKESSANVTLSDPLCRIGYNWVHSNATS